MEGIPEDLLADILLRLPVKDLLRFRCVSKRWRDLIDSPYFVKSQLNLPNKPQFVMGVVFDKKLHLNYSELSSDYTENPSLIFKELIIPSCDVVFPYVTDVVGHCDGLLCCVCEFDSKFLVLNPFTGKHIEVKSPEQYLLLAWGFGYDRDSDDYKIADLAYCRDWDSGVVWIYSLKSRSWKSLGDFPYIPGHYDGVFVNGALHWIGCRIGDASASHLIFAVNIGNSEYFSVPHPSDCSDNSLTHLGVLDGCLYAVYLGLYGSFDCCYELWVMKEYGVKESWTRLWMYDGFYDARVLFFGSYYGDWPVQCRFGSFWRKFWNVSRLGSVRRICQPLVYEPSLVCPRMGV